METMQHPTTELEFTQAMQDFKTMFPSMDGDVIEVVLRANQGAVDATIDQLLSMSSDNENEKARHNAPPDLSSETSEQASGELPRTNEPLRVTKNWQPAMLQPLPPGFLRLATDQRQSGEVVVLVTELEGVLPLHSALGLLPMWFAGIWNRFRIRQRWKKRERRRIKAEIAFNLIEADLEDERIAMLLQNEEFMSELRWNKDFLTALDNESPPEERLSSFPMRIPDDDALFKERLRNMGKLSRKKFAQLARVFTGKKKKGARSILSGGPAPSRDNLLLREDHENDY